METLDYIGLVLVYAIIAAFLVVALTLEKKGTERNTRKIVHIGIGTFIFVWWMFSEAWIMLVFFAVPFVVLLFIAMFKGNAISDSELGNIANNKGHRTGLFFYAVCITVLILFCFDHWTAATVGIAAMTFGDGFGSVIGKKYGKHKIIRGKSLEGSAAVFVATFAMSCVVILFYGWLAAQGYYPDGVYTGAVPFWVSAAVAGAIATAVEAVCSGEYDNIVMPLTVTLGMILLGL